MWVALPSRASLTSSTTRTWLMSSLMSGRESSARCSCDRVKTTFHYAMQVSNAASGVSGGFRDRCKPASGGFRGKFHRTRGLHPQVGFLHFLRREELLARPGLHYHARLQHIAAMRDLERLGGVLLDQQHRRALGVDLANDLEDCFDQDRCKAERRFCAHQP